MNEVTLPPSPNWYLSTILACAEDGTVAWASKNALVIGERRSAENKILDYKIISNTHTEKIHSLSFCPDYGKGRNLIITGGDDHVIKAWNVDTMEMSSSKAYIDSNQKVIAVDWSKCDTNLICSITSQGVLLTWQFSFNTHQIIPLGKITATCLSCSLHKSNLIAIGTKTGLIYIVNIQGTGTINYKLRGHDHEITSLSWCPTALNMLNEKSQKDYLLASGAKDRSIFIWRAGSNGKFEAQVNLPNTPHSNSQHRSQLNANVGAFTVLLWVEPNYLIAGSIYGELLSLNLSSVRKKQKPNWKVIHGCHLRAIFSIASFVKATDPEEIIPNGGDENWRAESSRRISGNTEIWSCGQERQVVCVTPDCNSDEEWKITHNIPTLAGFVYGIAPCPLDTSRIAFGVGDGMLRVWNLSEPHETTFDVTTAWQKIMGRLSSIAWHPDKENLLAYGTTEGRIGVYDTCNFAKQPVLLRQHHRKTIYRLEWGPSPPSSKTKPTYSLYCCGDGELTCFNYEKFQEQPIIIIDKCCSDFSWKPDYSCMAVGHTDGSIIFLNEKLEKTGKTIFILKKSVETLAWHPDSTVTDTNYSEYRNYLAASSTSPTITIFDVSTLIEQLSDENKGDAGQNFYKVVATLCGHSERIFTLNWSPHISGYLVSGSADKLVQVWKIDRSQIVATYNEHCNGVYSAMWSPLSPDLMISGSSDCSLRIWRISSQSVVMPSQEAIVAKSKSKKSTKKLAVKIEDIPKEQTEQSAEDDEASRQTPHSTANEKKSRGRKGVSYFPNYRKEANKESILKSCLSLARHVKNGEACQSLFGNKEEISKILKTELETHWSQGHSMITTEMSLWNGSLKETLLKAVENQTLSDFMVSLAPSLSMKMWQDMCEAYANQLIQQNNPMKAVSYLLVIHKIHQAINVLMGAKKFQEAYVIARCKLEPDDDIIKELTEEWSSCALKSGLLEDAALCAIYDGDISKAAKLLARRKDVLTLETAAEMALFDENQELSDSLAAEALEAALSEFNYHKAREVLEKFSNLHYRCIQVDAHEEIMRKYNGDVGAHSVVVWLNGESSYGVIEALKRKYKEKTESLPLFYKKLHEVTYSPLLGIQQSRSMLWLTISRDLALSVAAPSQNEMTRHIVSILGGISRFELMNSSRPNEDHMILVKFLSILEPWSPSSHESMFHFENAEEVSGAHKSLQVYLCLGLLNWLVSTIPNSTDEECIPVSIIMSLIQKSIPFILDRETVTYWMTMTEITKLENLLATAKNEGGDNDNKNAVKKLEEARCAQKKFIDERVCAPSPMLAYSKATELCSLLEDEIKADFQRVVADAWERATSFPNEK